MLPVVNSLLKATTKDSIDTNLGSQYVNRRSTSDLITHIELGYFPSLEKDTVLKARVKSAFLRVAPFFNKQNRPDILIENGGDTALTIESVRARVRDKIRHTSTEVKQLLIEAAKQDDISTTQRIYGEMIAEVYRGLPENAPIFCGEIAYLLYNLLCQENIQPEEMRVIVFTKKDSTKKNHALIVYCANPLIFRYIENYCGINSDISGSSTDQHNAYSLFIDWFAREWDKETLLIFDPWSRENKIFDPHGIKEDRYRSFVHEQRANQPQADAKSDFIALNLNRLLVESGVVSKMASTTDLINHRDVAIFVDCPLILNADN